jgi:predicted ATP-dependent serine protease
MADEQKQTADWKCNNCGATENVNNGFCKECGAVQTTPLSDKAQVEAGIKSEGDAKPRTQENPEQQQQGE